MMEHTYFAAFREYLLISKDALWNRNYRIKLINQIEWLNIDFYAVFIIIKFCTFFNNIQCPFYHIFIILENAFYEDEVHGHKYASADHVQELKLSD